MWRARWREFPNGPQKARQFRLKADAQRFLDGVVGDIARGAYVDPDAGRITFRDGRRPTASEQRDLDLAVGVVGRLLAYRAANAPE